MGAALSFLSYAGMRSLLLNDKESKTVMVGLDAAGKTTILFNLKLNEVFSTIPTIGFNVEQIQWRNIYLTIWDIGGQDKIRKLWNHYYDGCNGIIYVVDSSDVDRMDLAREELHKLMNNDLLRNATLLVYANKQDLPNALSASQVAEKLNLSNNLKPMRNWYVQPCCGTSREGLYEGLDWLSKNLE